MEALNRLLFGWLAAGYSPQPLLLLAARPLAEYAVLVTPLVLLVIWFRRPACRDSAVAAAICGVIALAASELIAALTRHPRPFMVGLSPIYLAHDVEGSFPSAHASLMLAVAATLLRAPGTRTWGALLAAVALLTGWARVYLGLHFPLDIAGSIVVAGATAALVRGDYGWIAWLRRRMERLVSYGSRLVSCGSRAGVAAGKIAQDDQTAGK